MTHKVPDTEVYISLNRESSCSLKVCREIVLTIFILFRVFKIKQHQFNYRNRNTLSSSFLWLKSLTCSYWLSLAQSDLTNVICIYVYYYSSNSVYIPQVKTPSQPQQPLTCAFPLTCPTLSTRGMQLRSPGQGHSLSLCNLTAPLSGQTHKQSTCKMKNKVTSI